MDPFAKFKAQMLEDDDEDWGKDFKKLNLPSTYFKFLKVLASLKEE